MERIDRICHGQTSYPRCLDPSICFLIGNPQIVFKEGMDHEKPHWQKNKLFLGISEEELQVIENFVQEKSFPEYEFILREGEKGKELYIIEDGHVEVLK